MTVIRAFSASGILADGPRLLRAALRVDAVVTAVNGLAYVALAGPLESLLGLDAMAGRAIGAFLLAYAVAVWAIAMPARIGRVPAGAVIEANAVWAVLSIVALVTGRLSLTTTGAVWAILQAAVVAGLAAVQYAALRRSR